MATEAQVRAFEERWSSPRGFIGMLRTLDNIPIAQRYLVTGFAFFIAGGVLALLMRIQLGSADNTFLDPQTYNQLFTMHGTTMMFLFVIPFLEALANYVLPLLLGTRDLPFPRLTALSYWTYLFGGILLYSSFLFGLAPDAGWFAYVPLSGAEYSPGLALDFWDIGLSVAEVAALGAAAEMIVAVLRMRAPGMSINRIPVMGWAMLVTAVMIIFAFTPLIVGTAMLELDRKHLTSFFIPAAGGDPLLWQHIFWTFGHPEVYIMFLPAVGIVTHIIQVFSRRPMVSYTLVVLALVATAFLSFGLWAHHMYATGIAPVALGYFAAASSVIAIPSGIQVFGWVATLWSGRPQWRTPLVFALVGLVIFVIGGITGVMVAAVPFDLQAHDTYFVVAHFHYVLFGGSIFPIFAGLYYWLPKMSGHMLHEGAGLVSAGLMFVGFNLAFFPMHLSGLNGMARRVYTYPDGIGLETTNAISTIGAFIVAAGVLLSILNFIWSLRRGRPAGDNPWNGDTLEWSVTSPPPSAQFPRLPVVRDRHPLWDADWRPESMRPEDTPPELTKHEEEVAQMDHWPTRWRGSLVVSVLEGRPVGVVHMPTASIAPFTVAFGFLLLFAGLIGDWMYLILPGLGVCAIGLVRWFWPQRTEDAAIEESGGDRAGELPLLTAGPRSSGYWGTLVMVAVLATALVTLVASYFYLLGGVSLERPMVPRGAWPVGALVAALLVVAARFLWHTVRRSGAGRLSLLALASPLVAVVLSLLLSWKGVTALDLAPNVSAPASAFYALIGFQWFVVALLGIMLLAALCWRLARPGDPRGVAVAHNAALTGYFAAVCGVVTFLTLYGASLG